MATQITHINKKHSKDKDNNLSYIKDTPKIKSEKELKNFLKDPDTVLFQMTKAEMIPCNILKYKKHNIIFPEPNPVSFYYSLAKDASINVTHQKKTLDQFYKDKTKLPLQLQHDIVIFSYIFKTTSVGIIFSFSAMEAFLNQLIPDNYTAQRKKKTITKTEIQRYFTFEDKHKLIAEITGKNFSLRQTKKFQVLKDIKSLRDELIHLKNNEEKGITNYTKIYQDVLDFNLTKMVALTKEFINYYKKDTIVEKASP